jgi:hypothetical protein
MTAMKITGPADLRRQHRLDSLVARLGDGIEAAAEIWANWYDGERYGELHPGKSAGDYISSLGYPLTVSEAMAVMPNASNRQIAAVAGVNEITIRRERGATFVAPDEAPARVTGADGKSYPATRPVQPPKIDKQAEIVLEQLRDGPKTTAELQVGSTIHAPRQIYTLRQAGHRITTEKGTDGTVTYTLGEFVDPTEEQVQLSTAGYRDLLAAFNAVGALADVADAIFMSASTLQLRKLQLAAHRAVRVAREFDVDSADVVVIGGESNGA